MLEKRISRSRSSNGLSRESRMPRGIHGSIRGVSLRTLGQSKETLVFLTSEGEFPAVMQNS